MIKENWVYILLLVLLVLDFFQLDKINLLNTVDLQFWSTLFVPIIIFLLTVNKFNSYQKVRIEKQDVLNKKVLTLHLVQVLELANTIYLGYGLEPIPPRLETELDSYEPYYIRAYKELEKSAINAQAMCVEYDPQTYEILEKSRRLMTNAHLQKVHPGLNLDQLHIELTDLEKKLREKL